MKLRLPDFGKGKSMNTIPADLPTEFELHLSSNRVRLAQSGKVIYEMYFPNNPPLRAQAIRAVNRLINQQIQIVSQNHAAASSDFPPEPEAA